jgi:hypothetical protein
MSHNNLLLSLSRTNALFRVTFNMRLKVLPMPQAIIQTTINAISRCRTDVTFTLYQPAEGRSEFLRCFGTLRRTLCRSRDGVLGCDSVSYPVYEGTIGGHACCNNSATALKTGHERWPDEVPWEI